jgi:ABC-type transport system involved in cytochrome bd biosynthesis fused ATPase/permease subunit
MTNAPRTLAAGVFLQKPFCQVRESVLSHVNALPADFEDLKTVFKLVQLNRQISKNTYNSMFAPLVIVGPSGAGKGTLITAL